MSELKNVVFYFERLTNFKHLIHIDLALFLSEWLSFDSLLAVDFSICANKNLKN